MRNIRFFQSFLLTTLCVLLAFSGTTAAANSNKAAQHANQLFHSPESPIEGNPNGSVIVVDFFDYQCSHCKGLSQTLHDLAKHDADVMVVFKELPIFGDSSEFASKAALAAAKQNKYLALHARLMALGALTEAEVLESARQLGLDMNKLKQDMKSKAVVGEIKHNLALSQALGIDGTPTLIITKNGKSMKAGKILIIPGALSEAELQSKLKQIRSA